MIIQQTGLPYLILLAVELLQNDIFCEGNYYEGDLLASVLQVDTEKWTTIQDLWVEVDSLIKDRLGELRDFRPRLNIDKFYAASFK
jgi:hypothetical protein